MKRCIRFRADAPLTRAAIWCSSFLQRRGVEFYFDYQGPAVWLDGDALALERSIQRVIHAAGDSIVEGVVFLIAEATQVDASTFSLTVQCGASGRLAGPAQIDAVTQRLELVADLLLDGDAQHAKGSCPATGAHLRFTFIPHDWALFSLYHLAPGTFAEEPAPVAADARAWLVMNQDAAFESLCLRLQRQGWAVTRIETVDIALARHAELVAGGHARPRLIIACESEAVPASEADRLARRLEASARCVLLVGLGSPSLAGHDTGSPLQVCVAPLSSSTLDTLTHELASTADRPSWNTTPSPLTEGDRALALIVDDDPITRLMVANLLAILGLDALEAEDGLEALEHCQARPPDLVLMDINMPRMNGIEATRALRQRQIRGDLPHFAILMVTSTSDPGAREAGERLGVEAFLPKPLTLDVLRHHIRCFQVRRDHGCP